jgi:hypothetical protein
MGKEPFTPTPRRACRLGGAFTLENSYLTVDPNYKESHGAIAERVYAYFKKKARLS